MYRTVFFIVTILAIALGLLIGTLNHEVVVIDLLWIQLHWPLGLLLLAALAAGVLLGVVLAWLLSVLPLRKQLRQARRSKAGSSGLTDRPVD